MTVLSSATFSLRRLDRWLAPWLPWLIVALAVGLRLWRLDGQSLWADEGNSAALALRSWADISRAAAADIHPPLYYWLLNLWVKIFGLSENGPVSYTHLVGKALPTHQLSLRGPAAHRVHDCHGQFAPGNPFPCTRV